MCLVYHGWHTIASSRSGSDSLPPHSRARDSRLPNARRTTACVDTRHHRCGRNHSASLRGRWCQRVDLRLERKCHSPIWSSHPRTQMGPWWLSRKHPHRYRRKIHSVLHTYWLPSQPPVEDVAILRVTVRIESARITHEYYCVQGPTNRRNGVARICIAAVRSEHPRGIEVKVAKDPPRRLVLPRRWTGGCADRRRATQTVEEARRSLASGGRRSRLRSTASGSCASEPFSDCARGEAPRNRCIDQR